MSKELNKLSTAIADVVDVPTEHPQTPQLTIQHALIMLTYMVEREFGEVTIPYSYVLEKVNGNSPANLDVFQNEDGSVTMKVQSDNTRTRIIL